MSEIIEKVIEKITPGENKDEKPMLGFDFDGIISSPPFNMNLALGRQIRTEELPDEVLFADDIPPAGFINHQIHRLRKFSQYARYFRRKPMPFAFEGIEQLSQIRRPVIITARSHLAKPIVESWLKKHNVAQYFHHIYTNNTNLPSYQYKLYTLRQQGIEEHIDDDGTITHYLATKGIRQLYLRIWPQNRGLPYPDNVYEFTNLSEVAQHIQQQDALKQRMKDEG